MKKKKLNPRDLPDKKVKTLDGNYITMKVVQSDSEHLEEDLLTAFRSNVARIISKQRS